MSTANILDGLPESLKSISAYEVIEATIAKLMLADHKHTKVGAFMRCKKCQVKVADRKKYLEAMGFNSYHQYLKWKQVMDIMKQYETETKAK